MDMVPDSLPQSLQDLAPQWAHFCLHVEQFINNELGITLSGKTIVCGVSGGADSTALLLVLACLQTKNSGKVHAVHLDHSLRPQSAEEAAWVGSLCAALSVDLTMERCDVADMANAQGIGLEDAGRAARYALFEKVMREQDADYLAVGHHLDDLCEDVLMRLMRGTAWPGLAGMEGHDPARRLMRPFLLTPKAKLEHFLRDMGVSWCEDSTNTDPTWTRNRVRHTLLPLFLEENPNFPESIARLWRVGTIDRAYWSDMIQSSDRLAEERLRQSHQAERLRLYKACLDALGPGQALADTLFKLDAAWRERRIGSCLQFPGGKTAKVTASGVVFEASH